MRTHRPVSRMRGNRGFTLLELGIVLGVTAILAAAIIPDMIESMRNRMAEKAAHDVSLLHDAARWFYLDSGRTALGYRWPGQQSGQIHCDGANFNSDLGKADLLNNGYVASDRNSSMTKASKALVNPWGGDYDLDAFETSAPVGGLQPGCLFGIATNLPQDIAAAFTSFLPQAGCNMDGKMPCSPSPTAVPAGYVRCCSFVPKPGYEMWKDVCPGGGIPQKDPGSNNVICP